MSEQRTKRTLTASQQVEYLRDEKGVRFDLISEAEARILLENRDYFFRIKAFAKNYEKYRSNASGKIGQYVNLDFGQLVELSELDDSLRELILAMTLDIEHAMKVRINAAAMRRHADAYTLVSDYLETVANGVVKEQIEKLEMHVAEEVFEDVADAVGEWQNCNDSASIIAAVNRINASIARLTLGKSPDHIRDSFAIMESSPYSCNLVAKYTAEDMPYWCLMELVSFGPLIKLYRTCFRKGGLLPDPEEATILLKVSKLLRCVQTMRNSAAHSDLLLHELASASNGASLKTVRKELGSYSIDEGVADNASHMRVAMDTAATLMCYDVLVVDSSLRSSTANRLRECRTRVLLHPDWFEKNYACSTFLAFVDNVFEAFEKRFAG